MKKILSLFVAMATIGIMFVACDDNDDSENKVESALVGTWCYTSEPNESGWLSEETLIFKEDGGYEFQNAAYSSEQANEAHDINYFIGEYSVKDDIVTLVVKGHGWIHSGQREPVPNFEEYTERIKFSIQDKKLTLEREYGTENAWVQFYTLK